MPSNDDERFANLVLTLKLPLTAQNAVEEANKGWRNVNGDLYKDAVKTCLDEAGSKRY